jgi:hypothetical protein
MREERVAEEDRILKEVIGARAKTALEVAIHTFEAAMENLQKADADLIALMRQTERRGSYPRVNGGC